MRETFLESFGGLPPGRAVKAPDMELARFASKSSLVYMNVSSDCLVCGTADKLVTRPFQWLAHDSITQESVPWQHRLESARGPVNLDRSPCLEGHGRSVKHLYTSNWTHVPQAIFRERARYAHSHMSSRQTQSAS